MNLKFNDTFITQDEAKTRLKAFLYDLAALQNRHGLYVEQEYDWVFVTGKEPSSRMERGLRLYLRDDDNCTVSIGTDY